MPPKRVLSHRRSRCSWVSACSMRPIKTPNHKVQAAFFEQSPERRDSALSAVLQHNSLPRPRPESDSTVRPGPYSTTWSHADILFSWCRKCPSKFVSEPRMSSRREFCATFASLAFAPRVLSKPTIHAFCEDETDTGVS